MFIYHYRIFNYYRTPVMSLAILGDEISDWRPQSYSYGLGGSQIRLEFPIVKLIDYEQRWDELEASDHRMVTIVMAHLRTKSTTGDPISRKQWKWRLTRRLYERGYEREDVVQLFRILDWMMTLPSELKREFREDLLIYEEQRNMPFMSEIELTARENEREETLQQVARNMLVEGLDPLQITRLTGLSLEQIRQLQAEQV